MRCEPGVMEWHRSSSSMVCDINLPGETGLALVRQVADELPDTAIVMVTAVDQPALADDLVISVAVGLRVRDLSRNGRLHVERAREQGAPLHHGPARAGPAAGGQHRKRLYRLETTS